MNTLRYFRHVTPTLLNIWTSKCCIHGDVKHVLHSCRLKDEREVTQLMEKAQLYIENRLSQDKGSEICRMYMRRIDHLYYKVAYNKA